MPQPYPPARLDDVVEDLHGNQVADPYRWLEDADHPDTQAWVVAQNALTEQFLAAVPAREEIRARLGELWNYPRYDVPFERGGQWFQTRNAGLQDQPVLYVAPEVSAEGRPLLDPNTLSNDGTVAVTGLSVSQDGSVLAYATSAAGSDWKTWHVRDVATGMDRPDLVEWSKFTSAAWRRDGSGFYYGAMARPEPGREFEQESRSLRILFHRVGTSSGEDILVFAVPDEPDWLPEAAVSDDDRYLIVSIHRGTNPETQVRILDLEHPGQGYHTLIGGFVAKAVVIGNVGQVFYVLTDDGADTGRIVTISLDDPARRQEVLAERNETLLEAHIFGGRLLTHYLRDAHSVLRVHGLDGSYQHDIPLPGVVSVAASGHDAAAIEGRAGSDTVHFRVTSFTESGSLWSHDLRIGTTALLQASSARIDPADYVTEQVFATSADGTEVPMYLTRRRALTATGDLPVLLYGYGGFDIPITPSWSLPMAVWMERGGMLAVANLRGGGEYGREWHDAGRLANKQHVFDDFCGCARWLHKSGWTRPERTAIFGGSNGGLLVGACLTQHPELFGAAVSDVGVFDMLRFHRFTIGWAWTSDYGSPDDPEQFGWLRAYSPLHNVTPGTCYPPTLLLTGDHDDRVVPGHSLKFAATLQAAQGCAAPVLLRVETAAGHGQGKPISKLVAESTDRLTFLEAVLGSRNGATVRPAGTPR
jgi:prolyl oligopeptidase